MRTMASNWRRIAVAVLSGLCAAFVVGAGSQPAAAQYARMSVHAGKGVYSKPVYRNPVRGSRGVVRRPPRGSLGTRIVRPSGRFIRGPEGWHRPVIVGRGINPGPGIVPPGGNPPSGQQPGGGGNGGNGLPPPGEQRFVPDEVLAAFAANASAQTIAEIAQRNGLTQLEAQNLPLIGTTLYRLRIGAGRSVASVISALQNEGAVASVQPNYVFTLQEQRTLASPALGDDAAQYVLRKLDVARALQFATGRRVRVAVIDSAVDAHHADLGGTIVRTFDALGNEADPQPHGTAIAGAIAAHGKLAGIAPDAQILAARAFDDNSGEARGTSLAIYKSIQWAADNAARVINMSFVGPDDPALRRMLAAAAAEGIVLIAAAGNAGANAAPLYPAADPNVIAVTATDDKDRLFALANRGHYIAVAAPGVDILALAPGDAYGLTTGTSVAAAHVSGVAALLLEIKPSLRPGQVRAILMGTAKPIGAPSQYLEFGAGLVNAYRAVTRLNAALAGKPREEQARQ